MATDQLVLNGIPVPPEQPEADSLALMRMIERMAHDPQFDAAKLNALLDVKERWEKIEARKAFEDAKAAFGAEHVLVTKDKVNKQYNSRYTSLGNLVTTVTPALSKHGLGFRWTQEQRDDGNILVMCILTHRLGHSEESHLLVPPDTSGSKNPLQEIKSAITYAKGCTLDSVCGTASSDANVDDDGNGAGKHLSDLSERLEWIENCKDLPELERIYKAGAKAALALGDAKAAVALGNAKDKRKRELSK